MQSVAKTGSLRSGDDVTHSLRIININATGQFSNTAIDLSKIRRLTIAVGEGGCTQCRDSDYANRDCDFSDSVIHDDLPLDCGYLPRGLKTEHSFCFVQNNAAQMLCIMSGAA
jgi:hypothetical protein